MPDDLKDTFRICLSCLQELVLAALRDPGPLVRAVGTVRIRGREELVLEGLLNPGALARALRSRDRWEARQKLLSEAEGIVGRGGTIC